jgi:hypothetical protein
MRRQADVEGRAVDDRTRHVYGAAMCRDQVTDHGQADA